MRGLPSLGLVNPARTVIDDNYPGRARSPTPYIVRESLIILGLVFIHGCKGPVPPPPPPPTVTVARPVQKEVIEWDEYTGHLDAVEFVDVRARVSGLIVGTPFQEGAIIAQGDLLVELDNRPFQADLDSKVASEGQAAAQVDIARITYEHLKGLMPEQSASKIEFQQAEANLKQAQAALAGAKANVESARLNVEWCRVTAPIAGRISRKLVTPGNLITGGSGTGTLLTTIASINPIYCYMDADERSVLKYQQLAREGKRVSARDTQIPCFLQVLSETGFPHEGVVDFVDNRMDPTTGTIRGRGVFPNPNGWLVPGFFARVRVPGSGRYQALLVPDAAIINDQNQKLLMVVRADDVIDPRPIKPGALFGDLRVIQSGIGLTDRVVVNGLMQARPGMKVVAHEAAFSTESISLTAPGSPTTQGLPVTAESDATAPAPPGGPAPHAERRAVTPSGPSEAPASP